MLVSVRRRLIAALLMGAAPAVVLCAEPLPRSVLYLDENDPGLPFAIGISAAFRATANTGGADRVAVFAENLDLVRSSGPRHDEILKTYLREKYRDRPVGVVVTVGPASLQFMLRSRAELWPEMAVVFASVDPETVAREQLPDGVTGLVRRQTLRDSVDIARRLMPNLKRLALVGDVLDRQNFRRHFKDEIPAVASELEIVDLTGLRMADLRARVAALPEDTAIYFTTLTFDGDRPAYTSRDALVAVAEVANRPIIVDLESNVGFGSLGGLVAEPGSIGREGARLALRILGGESVANIPVTAGNFVRPVFDWRQLQKWGIDESRTPPGSELRFRQASAWEQYHSEIVLIALALVLQSGLIIGLIHEHRRRRRAEREANRSMAELAQVSRLATAGEMSASIAHEINQPLAAIVTNANAGLRWLASATPDLGEAGAALKRIVSEGHRASEVIGSIRAMFKKDKQAAHVLDMNALIRQILRLARGQIELERVSLHTQFIDRLPLINGNRVQLQQVLLNLIANAIEAMSSVGDRPRVLRITTETHNPPGVVVSVTDTGTGIDPQNSERIFDAFFTTKSSGMGMGLSICRSIVEAHGGRLSAAPAHPHGTVFQVFLPLRNTGAA
jgi:signal transduction histidine kinase